MGHIAGGAGDPLDPAEAPSDELVALAAAEFAMLADPTRLKLLWLLSDDERDVTTLARLARTSPTAASQHLSKLRLAGLVEQRADGQRRVYSIRGDHLRTLLRESLYHADHQAHGIPHTD
ncbi:MAG: transcriptional regulator, ArsR family [Frankiales bacterium]|nr:transcriptional regulator, ArsR family [Frankiales bacterium]